MVCSQRGIKKLEIEDLKLGIGIEKSNQTRLKMILRKLLIMSLSWSGS